MLTLRYFVMPLFGAIYASGWWAYLGGYCDLKVPLVLIGISYGICVVMNIARDIIQNM